LTVPEPRLITIPLSPFNELARWSLDHAGVTYDEEPNGLIFHVIASRRVGGKGTTPVLVADGEVIGESAEIAEWADRHRVSGDPLFPEGETGEEAKGLMYRYVNELGPAARRIIWKHLVNDPGMAARYWGQRVSPRQARFGPITLRLGKIPTKRALKLDREHLEEAPVLVRSMFDEVTERLAEGGRIVGDRLTGADIAFACMCVPAVCPAEGHPKARMPQPEEFPDDVAATIRELRAHPAGEYALRMFREERHGQPPPAGIP
jgi:glutathione S-transferase